ncbi:SDR16C5 [Symbiodinium sp. KB8]|nr:SDR16C5 [Symbiodinium sp. KB8]
MDDAAAAWSRLPTWVKAASIAGGLLALREVYARATEKSVAGEVVLITGAGSGIGRLMAHRFAGLGGRMVLWDINAVAVQAVAEELTSLGHEAKAFTVDVADRTTVYKAAGEVLREFARVDILVNNAGIVSGKSFLDNDDEKVEKTFAVNTLAHFWSVKAFLPGMVDRNHGHIVTISSASSQSGVVGLSDYAASKWAAFGFDESLRLEFRKKGYTGLHTTCICPYYINTGMFEGVASRFSFLLPLLQPEFVADSVVTAVRRNTAVVMLPSLVWFTGTFRLLLPTSVYDSAMEFLGISASMDDFVGRGDSVAMRHSRGVQGAPAPLPGAAAAAEGSEASREGD